MKKTTIKISVTQDGLLPEEVTLLGKIFIPPIQKQILSLGRKVLVVIHRVNQKR